MENRKNAEEYSIPIKPLGLIASLSYMKMMQGNVSFASWKASQISFWSIPNEHLHACQVWLTHYVLCTQLKNLEYTINL